MGMFGRIHYQAIAEVFASRSADTYQTHDEFVVDCSLVEDFCDMFEKDNPNFEREKFLKACGMEEG